MVWLASLVFLVLVHGRAIEPRQVGVVESNKAAAVPGPPLRKPAGYERPIIPRPSFKTEPDFRVEKFSKPTVTEDSQLLADGYLFLDPMFDKPGRGGPQIYDQYGTLIWQGNNDNTTMNFHVCDYLGKPSSHLCWHRKDDCRRLDHLPKTIPPGLELPDKVAFNRPIKDYGRNIVFDETYTAVKNYTDLFDGLPANGHVFQMLQGGQTFLGLSDSPTVMDLRPYGYEHGRWGWVDNQCISETDVRTGENVFHWCYLESGMPIWETQTFFRSKYQNTNSTEVKVGTGEHTWAWDFLHLNSADKTPQGDYYVSFRHGDQILKIAGPSSALPGAVLWRLGGRSNDFELIDFPFSIPFSRQHDVQWISSSGSEEVISIFNNAFDGEGTPSQTFSEGQVIRINTASMTARLERRYVHPRGALSAGRGNMQHLPNGNVLIGWGTLREVTEYHQNGTVLYHMNFTCDDTGCVELSYRAYKSPWKGRPATLPKLVAYPQDCGAKVAAYVSWNGATEVARWRFRIGPNPDGPWVRAGTFAKDGFETQANLTSLRWFGGYVLVEALDAAGNTLARTVNQTFVPSLNKTQLCHGGNCGTAGDFFHREDCGARKGGVFNRLATVVLDMLAYVFEAIELWDAALLAHAGLR